MSNLPTRPFGKTGRSVTQLGYGAMELRGAREESTDERAEQVLNAVLDAGITLIDTAPDYGVSEERIGRYISSRRSEYFLATKCGCNITEGGVRLEPGHIWSGDRIRRNIDQSLKRLNTDHVDLVQMHNPSVQAVKEGGLVDVLLDLKQSGKTRFIGVSSTAPDLQQFSEIGVFDAFQVPYSALQRQHESQIGVAADAGAAILIRGGVAKGHNGAQDRWSTWEHAGLDELLEGMDRYTFVLRFTLSHPACHTTIVGTASPDHVAANVAAATAGPLPDAVYQAAKAKLAAVGELPQ